MNNILLNKYGKDKKINKYINDLCKDIVNNIDKFKEDNEDDDKQSPMAMFGIMTPKNQ